MLNSLKLSVTSFLGWVAIAAATDAKELMQRVEFSVSRKKPALKESQFLNSEHLVLCELELEQVRQLFRASLAIFTCAMNYC